MLYILCFAKGHLGAWGLGDGPHEGPIGGLGGIPKLFRVGGYSEWSAEPPLPTDRIPETSRSPLLQMDVTFELKYKEL